MLEEAPAAPAPAAGKGAAILIVSARSREALCRMKANLSQFLREHADVNLFDAAYLSSTIEPSFTRAHRTLGLVAR